MNEDLELLCDFSDLNEQYEKYRKKLDTSLKMYRLVVVHNIVSEIPKMQRRVVKYQLIFDELYKVKYPFGDI